MFNGPTQHASDVDSIMFFIIAVSVGFLVIVTVAMIYFIFRYNKKRHPQARDVKESAILEVVWIAIPTILVLFMFYFGLQSFYGIREIPADASNIKVIGRMWQFSYAYPNGKKSDTLFLAKGKNYKLDLITTDVNHSFFIPAYRIKEDLSAGKTNYMVLKPAETGEFDIACSEYCGLNHSKMYSKLIVLEENQYNEWLNQGINKNTDSTKTTNAAEKK